MKVIKVDPEKCTQCHTCDLWCGIEIGSEGKELNDAIHEKPQPVPRVYVILVGQVQKAGILTTLLKKRVNVSDSVPLLMSDRLNFADLLPLMKDNKEKFTEVEYRELSQRPAV